MSTGTKVGMTIGDAILLLFGVLGVAWLVVMAMLAFAPAEAEGHTFTAHIPRTYSAGPCGSTTTLPTSNLSSLALIEYGQQSPTWVLKREVMLANPDSFAFYWPVCAAQAAPHQVASKSIGASDTLATITFVGQRGLVYYTVVRTSTGKESCRSNTVRIP